ncbi:MAG: sulfite exporter TauE/SafE family protein [Sphingopyxis sp.]
MMVWLAPLFAAIAALYASVGFAGGSSYTAVLVLAGVAVPLVPVISLACNIIVSAGGVIRFARASHIAWRRVAPLLILSVPCAWMGGRMPISGAALVMTLGCSLLAAGALLLLGPDRAVTQAPAPADSGPGLLVLAMAAPLGLLSGIVGIGGGIFLAPILHLLRWDSARRIAGMAALFIFANSLSGIAGQLTKLSNTTLLAQALGWWPLILAVLIGGQLGSHIGTRHLPPALIRRVTGLVIIIAAVRLLTTG